MSVRVCNWLNYLYGFFLSLSPFVHFSSFSVVTGDQSQCVTAIFAVKCVSFLSLLFSPPFALALSHSMYISYFALTIFSLFILFFSLFIRYFVDCFRFCSYYFLVEQKQQICMCTSYLFSCWVAQSKYIYMKKSTHRDIARKNRHSTFGVQVCSVSLLWFLELTPFFFCFCFTWDHMSNANQPYYMLLCVFFSLLFLSFCLATKCSAKRSFAFTCSSISECMIFSSVDLSECTF